MRKKILILSLLSLATLASCGDGGGSSKAAQETFELQIFAGGYGTAPWTYALQKFEKAHPEYKIIANMDNNVNEAMANRWRDGNPPDFVFLDGTIDSNTWLSEGLLEDLSPWLETAKPYGEDILIKDKVGGDYFMKYTDSAKKTITYGFPIALNAYGMWYDQTLFGQKKWTMPTNYNELKTFAGNATETLKTLIYPGVYSGYLTQGLIVPAIAEYGQEFFDKVMNATDPEVYVSAEFKDIMNRFNTFVNLNANVVYDCLSMNHTQSQSSWLNHTAAMIPNGLWLRHEMDALKAIPDDFHMRYAPSPLVKEKQNIVVNVVRAGIASEAKNKKAAKEFMEILATDDVVKQFALATDAPSPFKVDLSNLEGASDVLIAAQQVFDNKNYGHYVNAGSWGGVDKVINDGVNSLVSNALGKGGTAKTVDQICEEIKTQAAKPTNK